MTVRQFIAPLQSGRLRRGLHLLLKVEGDIAELLLDVADDFTLGGGRKSVAALHKEFDDVVGEITAGQVEAEDRMRQGIALVDGDGVGDAIARVKDDTGGASGRVEGQNGLNGDVESWGVEGLEHDLGHLLAVGLGVQRSLGQEDGVLLGGDTQFVVEGVMPNLFHVIPVGDNTVLNGVFEGKDTTFCLRLIAR